MPSRRRTAKRRQRNSSKRETVVRETTTIATRPTLEIRRAGTLAQALTEPAAAVVKPEKKVTRVVRRSRSAA